VCEARRDSMPTYATGLCSGKRHAVLGIPTRHQRRVYAKPGGLQVADWRVMKSGTVASRSMSAKPLLHDDVQAARRDLTQSLASVAAMSLVGR